jgi:hypothetical protein
LKSKGFQGFESLPLRQPSPGALASLAGFGWQAKARSLREGSPADIPPSMAELGLDQAQNLLFVQSGGVRLTVCNRRPPGVGIRVPHTATLVATMATRLETDFHIKALQALCEQAEELRRVAEDLCAQLTARIEHTRRTVRLSKPIDNSRRKSRKVR